MDEEREGAEPTVPLDKVDLSDLRAFRLQQEKDWYLSDDGFLDFVRDSGAAPDAQEEPHGVGAHEILNWKATEDPEAAGRLNYLFKLVLWPRGSYKSSVFDMGYAAWLIAGNPNLRILVCSETGKQARAFVEQTKMIIDSPWYRERFGIHRDKRWIQGSFYSAQRDRSNIKEPTLQATGVGEVRTGSHWDVVIMDDVCSQENTKTAESIEALWYWFGETMAQLDPGCKLLVIGTLHHFADIYCRILKEPAIKQRFETSIHAWCEPLIDPDSTEPTKLFFPGNLTRAFVSTQKAIMPPRLFACFYENRPTTEDEQIFRPEYFRVIENNDIPAHVWTYVFTDFAFIADEKRKGRADRTVFWVVSLDCTRSAYVRDFYVGRWKPSDSVRIACDLWNRYQNLNLRGIAVEESTHKELLSSMFDEVRRQTFIHPKLITISGRAQEVKDLRIEAAEPRFRRGDIYFSRTVRSDPRKWNPLFAEMTEWPYSKHDDIPDAISDLDKQDKDGRYFCPAPPPGWRAQVAVRHKPVMIDGSYNPDLGYPAREFIKQNQTGPQTDIWNSKSKGGDGGPLSPSQSIFRRQPQSPGKLGGS